LCALWVKFRKPIFWAIHILQGSTTPGPHLETVGVDGLQKVIELHPATVWPSEAGAELTSNASDLSQILGCITQDCHLNGGNDPKPWCIRWDDETQPRACDLDNSGSRPWSCPDFAAWLESDAQEIS
jgi:hypothetical protein